MTPKITSEMQAAIDRTQGQPIEVEDGAGGAYVLVPKATYVHLSNFCREADETTRAELRRLIGEGIDSGPSIPADQLFTELRQLAVSLDSPPT